MENQGFGSYLRTILDQRGMSGNQLAKAAGVTEGTIRNLLKQGEDPSVSSPHPKVLRAISEVLGLDIVQVLQMMDYVPADYRSTSLTPLGEYVGATFDQLLSDGQRVVLGVLASFTGDHALAPDAINALAAAVRDLRKAHPMFIERKFQFKEEASRFVGNLFGAYPDSQMAHSIASRLTELFRDDATVTITEDRIKAAAAHPHGRVLLNLLLPRKEIANPLEKMYWLMYPNDTFGIREEAISDEQRQGIRALWRLFDPLV